MATKLYVGNLPYSITQQTLQDKFSQYGDVTSVSVITDRDTGQNKGFAFVEMSSGSDAQKAIDGLNGTDIDGRSVKVNEAKPQAPRDNRGGGFGGGAGGGSRSGGGGGFGGGSSRSGGSSGGRW
ncbi:MAG: hypothetical protein RL122_2688 [Pseudomonadota bacterium]|jgi:RNA recognition motif-containing protein|uniref:RNA-binding protein n=1 Tax=Thiothrix fructosivorans TaxID=111770 RepID=A0A8B0SU24_9GAMM|nr:RNA-binding protein [Thiothrix fructosivorans]MBO0612079.1 RNA-binding protein [Thiothrix fructosivorans]QTX12422.1 RNA-binding protein [Thiothrix fructosivorans]